MKILLIIAIMTPHSDDIGALENVEFGISNVSRKKAARFKVN